MRLFWILRDLGRLLFSADSVRSVGIVSELTTLETVAPLQAPPVKAGALETQPDLDYAVGQPANVPYLPQCKFRLQGSDPVSSPSTSHRRLSRY